VKDGSGNPFLSRNFGIKKIETYSLTRSFSRRVTPKSISKVISVSKKTKNYNSHLGG